MLTYDDTYGDACPVEQHDEQRLENEYEYNQLASYINTAPFKLPDVFRPDGCVGIYLQLVKAHDTGTDVVESHYVTVEYEP